MSFVNHVSSQLEARMITRPPHEGANIIQVIVLKLTREIPEHRAVNNRGMMGSVSRLHEVRPLESQ